MPVLVKKFNKHEPPPSIPKSMLQLRNPVHIRQPKVNFTKRTLDSPNPGLLNLPALTIHPLFKGIQRTATFSIPIQLEVVLQVMNNPNQINSNQTINMSQTPNQDTTQILRSSVQGSLASTQGRPDPIRATLSRNSADPTIDTLTDAIGTSSVVKPKVAKPEGGKKMDSTDSSIQPTLLLGRFPSTGESSSHPKDFPLVSDQGGIHSGIPKVIGMTLRRTNKLSFVRMLQQANLMTPIAPQPPFFQQTFRSFRTEGSIIHENTGNAIPQIRSEILMHEAIASGHPELEGKRPPRIPLGSSFSGLKLVRHDTSTPQDPPGLLSPNHTKGVNPGVRQASSLQQTNSTPRIQRIITLGKVKSTNITIDTDSMEDGSSRDLCFSLWPAPRDHFSWLVEAWSCLVHELRGTSGCAGWHPAGTKKSGFQAFARTCSSAVLWTWDFRLLRSNPHQCILAHPHQHRGLDEFTHSRSSSH